MAAYLIDYENVKSEGIRGILQLCEQDSVIIFYSHNADTLTFETMDMIFGSKATVRKYKIVRGGKNALDFQLSTYLGYLIHEGKDSCFYIISKDNGFQHVVEFWKRTFNYDGYVYCFPTIADAYAKHRRFEVTSAKEREKAIEEDMQALQETAMEEESELSAEEPVTEETAEESAAEKPVAQPSDEEETAFEEYNAVEDTTAEEDNSEPIITITSHEDNFIIEAIHEETAVIPDEPVEPAAKPAQIPVFSASLAEKIAAAVPDSWLKVTVVENNVTVHQVPDESETASPAAVEETQNVPAAVEETSEPESTVAETAEIMPEPEISSVPETVIPEPEAVSEETVTVLTEEPEEKPHKPVAKKKSRQTSRKKTASPKSEATEEKAEEPKAELEKEPVTEPEPVAAEPAAVKVQEENTAEEAVKPARRKQSHHGGRRKKNPAAPAAAEAENTPAAAPEEKEPERKQHHAQTGGQRGRRPKAQKSEAAAFTD